MNDQKIKLTQLRVQTDGKPLETRALRSALIEAGADDVGFVSVDAPGLEGERDRILAVFPKARTFVSYVVRMSREPIRSPDRSLTNNEFHARGHDVDGIGRQLVRSLEDIGVGAVVPSMGFPMNMEKWPNSWLISHKPIAVAAGLGIMGIHRCVIHPKYGSFVLLGTVVIDAEVSQHTRPLDFNPCFECKLCVAACPTGAIKSDGAFDFSACYTHNYREFMTGFGNWVETIADAGSAKAYRKKVEDRETVSMWQSLGFGPNYKSAYCIGVCPAGEDIIGRYEQDKKGFIKEVVRPLQAREETVYAIKGADAERYAVKRFPHKPVKQVHNGLRPVSASGFLEYLPHLFQPGASEGLDARYHFRFTGDETINATVAIANKRITVESGLAGEPDMLVRADSKAWVDFVRGDISLVWCLLTRKIRPWGDPRLLLKFGRCFPS